MRVKVTDIDLRLPHQIIIMAGRTVNESAVSCNCLRLSSQGGHKPMGSVINSEGSLDELKKLYNNPLNHNLHLPAEQQFHPAIQYAPVREVEIR